MQRALRIAIAVAAIVLVVLLARRGFHRWSESDAASAPAPDPFHYQAEVELGAVRDDGARLGGVLDLSLRDLDRACEGDEAAIALVRDRIATHPHDDAVVREIARLPSLCFEPPNPPGPCAWAASEIERDGELASAAWATLAQCPSGIATPFFDRVEAPAQRVLELVASREVGSPWLRPSPRLPSQYARAVLELASRPELVANIPTTGPGLGIRYDDPAVSEALSRAYDSAPDAARRLVVAQALGVVAGERARALSAAACASIPSLAGCFDSRVLASAELLFDASSFVERHPAERPRVLAELEACALGHPVELVGSPATCLAGLATLDWPRARTAAADADTHADSALAGLAHSLVQYPSASDLVLALRSRQLLGAPRATEAVAVTAVSVMAAYGRGWILGRSASSAFGHDRLARHLLQLAGLSDVEVDETAVLGTAPLGNGSVMGLFGRPTRLRAFSRGETFVVTTASDGDYYDLDAVVGLLNVVARTQGTNVRFLVVVDPLAEEAVVLGPPGELASAVAQGLLETPGVAQAPNLPF